MDTRVALGAVSDDPRLSDIARRLIADRANEIFVSVATLWEISIKFSLGRDRPNTMQIGSETAQEYFAHLVTNCWIFRQLMCKPFSTSH